MKITFVIPNLAGGKHFLQPPLDTLYSLAYLKSEGYECNFIDNRVNRLSFDELIKTLPKSDVFVVNTAPYDFSQMYHFDYRLSYSIATADKIKQNNPDIPLVLTGIHVNVQPKQMLTSTNADVAVLGEVEKTIVELMKAIEERKPLESVSNLVLRDGNNSFLTKKDMKLARPSLDGIMMPDYGAIDFEDYYGYELVGDKFRRVSRWGIVLGSRGCPYSCNFCHNFWGNEARYRSVDSVVEEVEILDKQHGVKNLFFLDPNFTINRIWAKEIADGIKDRGVQLPWSIQTRFNLVDSDTLDHLANAGCRQIFYGLESYNDDVLQRMDKKITTALVNEVVGLTKSKGITPFMFIMLGAPGETKKGIRRTVDFLRSEEVPYIAIVYGPRFGTEFQRQHQHNYRQEMGWQDLLNSKGIIDNEIDDLYLAKVVRYLRKQNVLRSKGEISELK